LTLIVAATLNPLGEMRRRWERAPASRSVGREVGSRWSPKLQQKHETRQRFHPQLKRLWDNYSILEDWRT